MAANLDAFLAALRPLLVQQAAQAAYLFGSQARGDAAPESDIDVIIKRMKAEERPFLMHALESARAIYVG